MQTVRAFLGGVCLAMLAAAAGCSSIAADDLAAADPMGATNTGTYPNLNIAPPVAARQLTEEEKATRLASLNGAKGRQAAPRGATRTRSPEELRRIARSHGQDTLNAISGE